MARKKQVNTIATHFSDLALVRQVRMGAVASFDRLVARHRAAVLHAAYALLGSWDLAEDVAQQTFVQAFRALPGLRDAEKFRPWLMMIMRRFALRSRAAQPLFMEFSDAFVLPPSSHDAIDEMLERINASLAELSARSRQVIALHYLDGYSCQEIGQRLQLSTGTVKRLLHDSRNSLRRRMGLAPHAKGKGDRMSRSEKTTAHRPRVFTWWISGSVPERQANDLLTRAIFLAIHKDSLTPTEIAHAVNADEMYIRDLLPAAVEEDLIRALPDERYQLNFIALEAQEWDEFIAVASQYSSKIAEVLQRRVDDLHAAWQHTTWPAQGFSWEEVGCWATIGAFVCSIGLIHVSPETPAPPLRRSGHRYWCGGRERGASNVWTTISFNGGSSPGVNYQFGYFDLWELPRLKFEIAPGNTLTLAALAAGAATPEEVVEQASMPLAQVRETLGRFLESGLVKKDDDRLAITFPLITAADDEALQPAVESVARQLVDEVLLAATDDVAARLKRMGYGYLCDQFPYWRKKVQNMILAEGIHCLLERGILPTPPDPAPMNFTMFGWKGNRKLTW